MSTVENDSLTQHSPFNRDCISSSAVTDRKLLQRFCQHADEEAFHSILLRHEAWVRHHCQLRLGRDADADDATQAVFVQLANKAQSIRDGTALAAWLQRTAHNVTANMLATASVRRRHERAAAQKPKQIDSDLPEDAQRDSALEYLPDCLSELRTDDREVIIRYYVRNQRMKDIADELQCSAGAVQKRITRAVVRLQQSLRRRGVLVTPALLMAMTSPGRAAPPPELIQNTLIAIRQASHNDARKTFTPSRSQNRPRRTSGSKIGIPAVLAAMFLLATIWASFHLPDNSKSNGPAFSHALTIIDVTDKAQVTLASGSVIKAGPGLRVQAGSQLSTLDTGGMRCQTAGLGSVTLREATTVAVRNADLHLLSGALLIDSEVERPFSTPLAQIVQIGQARLLVQNAFVRIDVVTGTVRIPATGQSIPAGHAFAWGKNCLGHSFAMAPEELSPRFGGLFYRSVADIYARGQAVLARSPQDKPYTIHAPLEEMSQQSPPGMRLQWRQHPQRLHVTGTVSDRDTWKFGIRRPGWPVIGAVHPRLASHASKMVFTVTKGSGRMEYGDGGAPFVWYDDLPWAKLSIPVAKRPPHIPTANIGRRCCIQQRTLCVGQTPDGRWLWERSLKKDKGNWAPPHIECGAGPCEASLSMPPGIELEIHSISFGLTTP